MGTLAVGTKTLHGIKRVPQWSHIGSTVYIGEKPTVTLYSYMNPHVGTPKQKKQTSYYPVILDEEFQTTVQKYCTDKLSLKWGLVLLFRRRSTSRRCEGPQIYSMPTNIYIIYESRCLKV